ncbi:MAG: hypothetical protein WC575_04835 [Patescibacteria group bacterium]
MKWSWLKILVPTLLLLPIVISGLFSNQPIKVTTDFTNRTPWFDYLLPIGRTERLDNAVKLISEPVYFELRLPMRAKKIKMTLQFKNVPLAELRLGVRQSESWDYFFPEQLIAGTSRSIEVTNFSYTPENSLRFIISLPNIQEQNISIEMAQAEIERRAFTWSWLGFSLVKKYRQWVGDLLAPLIRATGPHYGQI